MPGLTTTLCPEDLKESSQDKPTMEMTLEDFELPDAIIKYSDRIVYDDDSGFLVTLRGDKSSKERGWVNPHRLCYNQVCEGDEQKNFRSEDKLHVIAVACRMSNGLLITAPRPAQHHHIMAAFYEEVGRSAKTRETGFLLSDGTYADRTRAGEVAMAAGQITTHRMSKPFLYSEDIWGPGRS